MLDNFQTTQYVKHNDPDNCRQHIKHYLTATDKLKKELIDQIKGEISNLDIEISYDNEYTPGEKANASFEYNGIKYNIDLKGQNFYDIKTKDDTSAIKVTEATITLTNEGGMITHISQEINKIITHNKNNIGPQKLITKLETIYNEKNKQATITIKDFENGNNDYGKTDDDEPFNATVEVNGMSFDISKELRPILINNREKQMKISISLDEQEQVKSIIDKNIDYLKDKKEINAFISELKNSYNGQATITIKDFEWADSGFGRTGDNDPFKATVEVNGMSVDISKELRPILINNGEHKMKIPISLDEQEQVRSIIYETINIIIPNKIKEEKELKENSIGGQNDEEIKNEFAKNGIKDITINRNIVKKYIPIKGNNCYQKQDKTQTLVDEIIVPGIDKDNFMKNYYDLLFDENKIKKTILKSKIKYICEQIKEQKEQVATLQNTKKTNSSSFKIKVSKGEHEEGNIANIKEKTEIDLVKNQTNEEVLVDPMVLENKEKEEIGRFKNETNKREQEIKKIIDDAEIESKKSTLWRSFLGIFIKKYKLEVKKIRFAKDILKIYKKGAKIEDQTEDFLKKIEEYKEQTSEINKNPKSTMSTECKTITEKTKYQDVEMNRRNINKDSYSCVF